MSKQLLAAAQAALKEMCKVGCPGVDELDEAITNAKREVTSPSVGAVSVWYGKMPESNGRSNWTAILHRGDMSEGHTIDRSEYPHRVRYEADRVRHLIGELAEPPYILDYPGDEKTPCHLCGGSGVKDGKPCWGLNFEGPVHAGAVPAAPKLTLQNAPIGTRAPAIMGGAWQKVEHGWKWWPSGSTFPRPGGDWTGELIAPEVGSASEAATEEIEAVIACLGDDAATLREEDQDDEMATTMERAAELLQGLLPAAPTMTEAEADAWVLAAQPASPQPTEALLAGATASTAASNPAIRESPQVGLMATAAPEGDAVREALTELLRATRQPRVSCQKGLMRCRCIDCVRDRADAALAGSKTEGGQPS